MPRFRSLVLISLLTVVVTTSGIATILAQDDPATPAVDSTTPTTTPSSSASPVPDDQASPVATPQLSAAECDETFAFHRTNLERLGVLQVALNEVGIGVGYSDPAAVDLDPIAARELAALTEALFSADPGLPVPVAYQAFYEGLNATFARNVELLRAYADAVESGQDPDAAIAEVAQDPELIRIGTAAGAAIAGLYAACGVGFIDPDTGRAIAAEIEAALTAQTSAATPPVVREANDALAEFLTALSSAWADYTDQVEVGDGPNEVLRALQPEVVPLGLAADDLLRGLLEACDVVIGVPSVVQPVDHPLTDEECRQVFAWYGATTEQLAALNAALREELINPLGLGIALPGNLGSVDLDDLPLADGTPGASPTSEATPISGATPMAGTPSPVATPVLSAEACDEALASHQQNQERVAVLQVAFNEVGIGVGFSDPADVNLDPTAARELADLIDSVVNEDLAPDVAAGYQDFYDLFNDFQSRHAELLREYADAVEAGQNPDDTYTTKVNDPEYGRIGAEASAAILGLFETCAPFDLDVELTRARVYASASEDAVAAQTSSEIPPVAQEANNAVLEFLNAFGSGWAEYADRVEAGEDPNADADELAPDIERLALAADDQLRGLLEGCGLVIGVPSVVEEIDQPLTEQDCRQVFAWYAASAERFAELNAVLREDLINLGEFGIALPGNLGSVDPSEFPPQDGQATPTTSASPGATPIADDPDEGSPVAAPVVTDEECLSIIVWHAELAEIAAEPNLAIARSGIGNAVTPEEKALVDLDAETARDLARLHEKAGDRIERTEVPEVAQVAKETRVVYYAALAAAFVAYADAVDQGADLDDALNALDAGMIGAQTAASEANGPLFDACGYFLAEFDESLVPRVSFAECRDLHVWVQETSTRFLPATIALAEVGLGALGNLDSAQLDSKSARDIARLLESFAREQENAEAPGAAEQANEIVIANFRKYAAALDEFAATLDEGGDPDAALDTLVASFTPLEAEATGQVAALQACAGNTIAETGEPPDTNG